MNEGFVDNKSKFSLLYFSIAIAIVSPKIGFIDFPILILLLIVIFSFFLFKLKLSKPIEYYRIVLLWGLLSCLAIITFLTNGKVDYIFYIKPMRQIILLSLILTIVFTHSLKFIDFFKIIILAAVINVVVIVCQLIGHNVFSSPTFLMFPAFDIDVNVPFRKPGLMAGYPHSGVLSVIGIVCMLPFSRVLGRSKFVFILILLTFSLIVTARTALIFGIFPLMIFFFKGLKSKEIFKKMLIFFVLGLYVIIYLISLLPADTYNVAFELFINLSENNKFSTESSDALINSWKLPKYLSTYLFGNGNYMKNDFGENTDDGFQIMLYGCGVLYFLMTLLIYFSYGYISYKYAKGNSIRISIILIFLLILIMNIKVDSIFSRVFSDIISFLFSIGLFSKYTEIHNSYVKDV